MNRPTGWDVLDLDTDPTPGDVWTVADLQRRWADISADAAAAEAGVRALSSDGVVSDWIGEAGDVFRGAISEFSVPLARCRDSYDSGAQALARWHSTLVDVQAQADRALADGKIARQQLDSALAHLASADAAVSSAALRQSALDSRPAAAPPLDPAQVRAAVSASQAAAAQRSAAASDVSAARAALDAAKALARDARDTRESTGRSVARLIDDAAQEGVAHRSWWDSVKDVAARAWDVLVDVAKVTVAVLGIVVLIVGGPLAWVVLAAALIVLADTLYEYSQGRASAADIAWSLLDCIPGTKGLTTTAKLAGALATLGDAKKVLAAGRTAVRSTTAVARGAAAGMRRHAARVAEERRRFPDRGSIQFGRGPEFDMSGINQRIARQKQERHVLDDGKHDHGGYFIDLADAQRVLTDAHNGVAEFLGVGPNGWPYFRHPDVRGVHRNSGGKPDEWIDIPTDIFFIKGTARVSVVPSNPRKAD